MSELSQVERMGARRKMAFVLAIIDEADEIYGKAFVGQPKISQRIQGVPYVRQTADKGVEHSVYTGFSEQEFLAVEALLSAPSAFGKPVGVQTSQEGARQNRRVEFANSASMVFLPFRDSGISFSIPDNALSQLRKIEPTCRQIP